MIVGAAVVGLWSWSRLRKAASRSTHRWRLFLQSAGGLGWWHRGDRATLRSFG